MFVKHQCGDGGCMSGCYCQCKQRICGDELHHHYHDRLVSQFSDYYQSNLDV